MKNKKINKKMSFAEVMETDEELAMILMEKGMHCCGCPLAMQESLEDGARAHGLNPDELIEELNENLLKKRLRKTAKADAIHKTDGNEKLAKKIKRKQRRKENENVEC